ncbi:MAG: PAC2 family protein [Candidatus Bathyarchaeia archaeon]
MDKTTIRIFRKLKLEDPVFIDLTAPEGTPVYALAQVLIDSTQAEKIGEVYSPNLPDYVVAEQSGICHLPRLEIYAAAQLTPGLLILTGTDQLDQENVQAYYELADTILKCAIELECRKVVACTTMRSKKAEERIYIAATDTAETKEIVGKHGGKPFMLGRITLPMGPLLGLAKIHGLKVLCIIGMITEDSTFSEVTQLLYDYLIAILEPKTDYK